MTAIVIPTCALHVPNCALHACRPIVYGKGRLIDNIIVGEHLIEWGTFTERGMAEDGNSVNVAAPGVSFTFQKKTKPVRVITTSLEAPEEKDLVFSLVGKQIERYVEFSLMSARHKMWVCLLVQLSLYEVSQGGSQDMTILVELCSKALSYLAFRCHAVRPVSVSCLLLVVAGFPCSMHA